MAARPIPRGIPKSVRIARIVTRLGVGGSSIITSASPRDPRARGYRAASGEPHGYDYRREFDYPQLIEDYGVAPAEQGSVVSLGFDFAGERGWLRANSALAINRIYGQEN
jgi:hypothetical protein